MNKGVGNGDLLRFGNKNSNLGYQLTILTSLISSPSLMDGSLVLSPTAQNQPKK